MSYLQTNSSTDNGSMECECKKTTLPSREAGPEQAEAPQPSCRYAGGLM